MPSDAAFREVVDAMLDAIEGHDDVVCCESDDGSHEWVLFPGTMKDFLRARVLALYAERQGEVYEVQALEPGSFQSAIFDLDLHGIYPGDKVRVTKVEEGQWTRAAVGGRERCDGASVRVGNGVRPDSGWDVRMPSL